MRKKKIMLAGLACYGLAGIVSGFYSGLVIDDISCSRNWIFNLVMAGAWLGLFIAWVHFIIGVRDEH